MLRESVRDFAAKEIAPRAARDRPRQPVPGGPVAQARRPRPARHHRRGGATAAPRWVISRTSSRWRRSRAPRLRSGLSYGAHSNLCVNQIRRNGSAAQKTAVPAEAYLRRARRRARDVRAGRRLRRGRNAAQGRAPRRPLPPQRQQDVDHQRTRCGRARGLRQEQRPGHHRLPHREGNEGLLHRAKARQARHARLEHLRARVQGLRSTERSTSWAKKARA